MNVPIRMVGIATVIFWVFLVTFIALAAYSIQDLDLDIGETQVSTTPNGELVFSFPVSINNKGYCNLNDLRITTVLSDVNGAEISTTSTSIPIIPQGESVATSHNVTLNMNDLIQKGEQYLLEDQSLAASVTTGLTLAELLPIQISTNSTYPWGAPFYQFGMGQPSVNNFNVTHYRVTVPVSFENHAVFDLTGKIRVQLYGSDETLLSETQTDFSAPRQSSYADEVEFQVALNPESLSNQSGYFKVYFSTSLFEYGPLVIPYG